MDFGRLSDISQVDFSLPADHAGVMKVLGGKRTPNLKVYIGCPVWSDPGFVGKIYPDKAKESDYVKYYSQQFNSIELNATHYKIPTEKTINTWISKVNKGFVFCPKVPQVISHATDISQMTVVMNEFTKALAYFKEHLATLFLQLSPHFDPSKLPLLLTFLDQLAETNIAIELRHSAWFSGAQQLNELCNYLYKNAMGLVITDVAGRRDVLHQRLTNKTAFIRFTANNLHPSDYKRLDDWALRCSQWIEKGLEKLYFFVHTPDKSLTPELALYFIQKINTLTGMKLEAPRIKNEEKQIIFF